MSEERKNGYGDFEKSLPLSAKDIVLSRYIFALGFILTGAAASTGATAFIGFLFDYQYDLIAFTVLSFVFGYVAFLVLCILFPIYYRFGTKYIWLTNILIVVIPLVINYLLTLDVITVSYDNISVFTILIAILLSFFIIAGSIYISIGTQKKKVPD
jgi:hypothetical protein